jgi:branched-chain amino acid transport system substrate-binding protein
MEVTMKKILLGLLSAIALPLAHAADTTGVTDTEIKIGIMAPLTGSASSYSKAEIGVDAYYKWINDQGGIAGRKIVGIMEDYACDSAKGIAAAKKLIYQDKVFMLHGNSCSAVAMAIKPTVVESGVPWVVAHAANPNISNPVVKNIFHAVPTGKTYAEAMAKFVMSKPGLKTVGVITHTNDWAKSYCEPATALLTSKGFKPVIEVALEQGQTDATAQVLKLKQANPDFILGCLYEAETAIFLRDAKKFGVTAPVMGTGGTDLENTYKRVGDFETVKNYYVVHAYSDNVDGPRLKKYVDIIHKYYPKETITGFSVNSIGSAVLVVDVLKKIGRDLTREKFIAEMEKVKDFDSGVFAAHFSYGPNDHDGVAESAVAGFINTKPTVLKSWGQPY